VSLYTTFDHYNFPLGPDGTPREYFEQLRDEAIETKTPIGWSEAYGGYWIVTGWEESREIHHNTTAFSNVESTFPSYGTPSGNKLMLAEMDEPQHKRYRRIVQGPFSPVAAAAMDSRIRALANRLIDGIIESGRIDVCNTIDHLPELATAAILGLPLEDAPELTSFVRAMVQNATDPEGAAPKLRAMAEYWARSVEQRRTNPGDDLLTEIVNAEYDGERLNDKELLDFFAILLLGGLDNTSRWLGSAFFRLAWDKELRRRLAAKPEMTRIAIEEFLRLDGPAMVFRLITERVEVAGVTIEPGQHLGLAHPVSNRDPRQFEHPDQFVPDRSPNRHFALGLGIHRCLGLHLVKIEGQIMVEEFLRRVPEFELDQNRKPRWVSGQVGAMVEVPIVFEPGAREESADTAAMSTAISI
jgi:cytochrome P450